MQRWGNTREKQTHGCVYPEQRCQYLRVPTLHFFAGISTVKAKEVGHLLLSHFSPGKVWGSGKLPVQREEQGCFLLQQGVIQDGSPHGDAPSIGSEPSNQSCHPIPASLLGETEARRDPTRAKQLPKTEGCSPPP